MTDNLGRSWGIVSHLKSVKCTEDILPGTKERLSDTLPGTTHCICYEILCSILKSVLGTIVAI